MEFVFAMSRHLERLIEIDALIRSQQKHTAKTLAEALEVSVRTIRACHQLSQTTKAAR